MCEASKNEIIKEEMPSSRFDPATRIPMHAILNSPMTCAKTGVEQYLRDANGLQRHYPNGDAYQCTACKSIVIRE